MTIRDPDSPSLLIYVHEDRLGDALLKLPAVAALRDAFPDFRITWHAGSGSSVFSSQLAPLVNGLIDRVEIREPLGLSWTELLSRPPPDRFYDVIIDTQTVIHTTLVLRRIAHGLFVSPAARFLFSDKKPGIGGFGGSMRQRLLQLIRLASGRPVQPDYRLQLPQEYRDVAAELLPSGPAYVGLAPGAGGRNKCWPLERFLELGRDQRAKDRVPVYFIGPGETEWLPLIHEKVPGALMPEMADAATGLRGPLLCMALAQRLYAGVANDSGAGHMLAAAGVPLVSLFGRTSVEKFVDVNDGRMVLRARDFGGKDIDCIPTAAVAKAVDEKFGRGNHE